MALIEPEDLVDPERIFVAGSLRVARRVEELLSMSGVNYIVQVEPFGQSILFSSPRLGAAFYVTASQAEYCRSRLEAEGLGRGIVQEIRDEQSG